MAFKLAIGDVVTIPVHFIHNPGGIAQSFKFKLKAKRLSDQDASNLASGAGTDSGDEKVNDFLRKNITGWEGQTLVLDENDKPCEFGYDEFEAMLSAAGMGIAIFRAYLVETAGRSGDEARRKN